MLLRADLVSYRIVGDRILPSWLTAADEPFVGEVLDAIASFAGCLAGEADAIADSVLSRIATRAGIPPKVAHALWSIERKRWDARIDAPVPPEALRDAVFELAARLPRAEAIAAAATRFDIASETVERCIFADRPPYRVLSPPDTPLSPGDVLGRYNLALVETLLARAMEIVANVGGDVAPLAAVAKREGLLASFEEREAWATLRLVGPLALFHETVKYGRALARFAPALVAGVRWSLAARIVLTEGPARLDLDSGGAIAFAHTLPAAGGDRVARKISRTLRSWRSPFRVEVGVDVVRLGRALVFPDFALVSPRGRVLVDLVPLPTTEYVARKLAAMDAAGHEPMLLCVDTRFGLPEAICRRPDVVGYRGLVDVAALVSAADAALDATSRASASAPSPSSSSSSLPVSQPARELLSFPW